MKRIAIIGGGISGLAAAFALEEHRRAGAPLEYVLYESSPRLGGVLRTEHVEGCVIEAGPDSFLTEKSWAADLCRTLGLGDQLMSSNDADRKTYILVHGRLVLIPDGLMFMVPTKLMPTILSPLFSVKTKLLMAREWFHPPRAADSDESVASLVERHYGRELVDRLADPLLSGIYGGEASSLSVRAVLPRFAEMERTHGSLGRAVLAARKQMSQAARQPARPLFASLKNGMQQLVDALLSHLSRSALLINMPIDNVRAEAHGWRVSAGAKTDSFDGVIFALPTHSAAKLLSSSCWPQRSSTISFLVVLRKIVPCCAASSEVRTLTKSGSFPTARLSASSAKTCKKSSDSAPSLFGPAYINGRRRWPSMASATLTAWSASNIFAVSCRGWRWRATAIAASASPTASAPVAKLLRRF